MEISTVGVIGAGQMGAGIAQVCALRGFGVQLHDVSDERIEVARAAIRKQLDRQVTKQAISAADAEAACERIVAAKQLGDLSPADLVIEAATENEAIKSQIIRTVAAHLHPRAILASNTSSISITKLAALTDLPGRVIGLHFMNPAPVMKLVEIIRAITTTTETYERVTTFAQALGKTVTNSEDYPAFIVNRVLIPMINEAVYAVYEGVGTISAVDTAMKLGANHPMGPLELADLIGLDTVASIMSVLQLGLGDPKYRLCPLLAKYVEAGWLGRKSGRGFYDYSGPVPTPTR